MRTQEKTPGGYRLTVLLTLSSNGLLTAILLAIQVGMLTWRGAVNEAWPFYVALVAITAITATLLFALVALRIVEPSSAINIYAWIGLAVISGFISADYIFERDTLPWGMFMLLPAGVAAVVIFGNLRSTIPYTIAASLIACITGCAYGQFGNTVAMLTVLVLVASISLEIKRLRQENEDQNKEIEKQDNDISSLQEAIGAVANNGRSSP